ncbi:hypothetical protein [uncultured Deinococcus sp.]|uniref:hypothetical protein n=1 Tax=uncultured Deinococcus sp. TaxID=158789 RepID=UPI0025EDE255|nr:hypothetical protein [uncultured Deinococcus sp.]
MPPLIQIDTRLLERRAAQAFRVTVRDLEDALPAAHQDRVYAWPGRTHRESGEVAGSPRTVYDTGTLADSQQPAEYRGPLQARITWDADYAAAVYLGAVFRKRQFSLPARNVPLHTLRALNLPDRFRERLAALL